MNTQILFGVAVVPAIIGLTQVAKELGLPSKASPAIAVLFGVLAALAQVYAGKWQWIPAAVLGISLGLSAVGLYSGVQSAFGTQGAPVDPPFVPSVPEASSISEVTKTPPTDPKPAA